MSRRNTCWHVQLWICEALYIQYMYKTVEQNFNGLCAAKFMGEASWGRIVLVLAPWKTGKHFTTRILWAPSFLDTYLKVCHVKSCYKWSYAAAHISLCYCTSHNLAIDTGLATVMTFGRQSPDCSLPFEPDHLVHVPRWLPLCRTDGNKSQETSIMIMHSVRRWPRQS